MASRSSPMPNVVTEAAFAQRRRLAPEPARRTLVRAGLAEHVPDPSRQRQEDGGTRRTVLVSATTLFDSRDEGWSIQPPLCEVPN